MIYVCTNTHTHCRQNSGVKDRYDSLTNSVKESSIIEPAVVAPTTGKRVSIPDVFNSPSPPSSSPTHKPRPASRNGVVDKPLPPNEKVRDSPAPMPSPRVRRKPTDGSPAPSPKTARRPRVRGMSGGDVESDGSPAPSPKIPRKPKFLMRNGEGPGGVGGEEERTHPPHGTGNVQQQNGTHH